MLPLDRQGINISCEKKEEKKTFSIHSFQGHVDHVFCQSVIICKLPKCIRKRTKIFNE